MPDRHAVRGLAHRRRARQQRSERQRGLRRSWRERHDQRQRRQRLGRIPRCGGRGRRDLALGQATNDGDGGVDTLIDIDRVRGSAFADQIFGSDNAPNTNERFEGMGGNDTIDGRGGFDVVHYTTALSAVTSISRGNRKRRARRPRLIAEYRRRASVEFQRRAVRQQYGDNDRIIRGDGRQRFHRRPRRLRPAGIFALDRRGFGQSRDRHCERRLRVYGQLRQHRSGSRLDFQRHDHGRRGQRQSRRPRGQRHRDRRRRRRHAGRRRRYRHAVLFDFPDAGSGEFGNDAVDVLEHPHQPGHRSRRFRQHRYRRQLRKRHRFGVQRFSPRPQHRGQRAPGRRGGRCAVRRRDRRHQRRPVVRRQRRRRIAADARGHVH